MIVNSAASKREAPRKRKGNNKIFTKNREKSIDFSTYILYNLIYMYFCRRKIMKKLLALLLAALMMISVVACANKDTSGTDSQLESLKGSRNETAKTEDTYNEYDTFQFEEVDTKTVRIVGFSTTLDRAHEVKIPTYFYPYGTEGDNINQKRRVVGIAEEAFNCSSSVLSLVFPTAEEYLAEDATFDMSKHTFVIESYALRDCVALQTLSLPAYVTEIGKGAFYSCTSLQSVTFAEGSKLTTVGESAFMGCTALTEIELPASTQTIERAAFFGCEALTSVVINEGTVAIGNQAFQKCVVLAQVKLPNTLQTIGTYAFHGSKKLYEEGLIYGGQVAAVKKYINELALQPAPEVPAE
jgi:hypothetical protein